MLTPELETAIRNSLEDATRRGQSSGRGVGGNGSHQQA